ncbi:unnamed protein product, partial [Nesidiocoris tenuis]
MLKTSLKMLEIACTETIPRFEIISITHLIDIANLFAESIRVKGFNGKRCTGRRTCRSKYPAEKSVEQS